ncbi:P protein-like [Contarinia nasturtii]|uniref:P protein-like n=1 Tax=Contarinia nasturtii TaxID=265458 RepID=UPI0012D391DD|nr:P protein-like [Contarinia nasturtii]
MNPFLHMNNSNEDLNSGSDSSDGYVTYGSFDTCNSLSNEVHLNSCTENENSTKNLRSKIESENRDENSEAISEIDNASREWKRKNKLWNLLKIALLTLIWIISTILLMSTDEKVLTYHQLVIPFGQCKSYTLDELPLKSRFGVILRGAFADEASTTRNFLYIQFQQPIVQSEESNKNTSIPSVLYNSEVVKIPIIDNISQIDTTKQIQKSHTFYLESNFFENIRENVTNLEVQITTNLPISFPINFAYDPSPIDKSIGVIYATVILIGLYIMIIWELIDRTFAAMIASIVSMAVLTLMNERPTMSEIIAWIDAETLLLLFGMMILVGILSETGVFDYLAVCAFKIARGKIWPLIYCLCLFTAFLSAMLDNVATLLLMTPISIRLCEVMQLNPIPILCAMIIFSNIGGSMTPIGDPPNIIIATNDHVVNSGVDFLTFSIHMSIGAILVIFQTYLQLRCKFMTVSDLLVNDRDDLQKLHIDNEAQSSETKNVLPINSFISKETYEETLKELQQKFPIRNRPLLIKSVVALGFVLSCFFLHSLPYIGRLSLGWTTLLGVILLLILYDRRDIESALERVEWSTLIFFGVLFVLMESLEKLGFIDFIGNQVKNLVLSVDAESRLAISILIILWVSAIASAFIDNIPLTTMMIRITISLAETKSINLPLQPLIWALSFGACLGGNGTLIGASANIVAASVAEQNGYRITFMNYFKIGFPVMIMSICVISGYLLVSHVVFSWH